MLSFITRPRVNTLITAALGAAVFVYLSLPLPLLLGPLAACLLVALGGVQLQNMGTVGFFFRTFLGVAIGSTVTADVATNFKSYVPTLALIPLFILVIAVVCVPLLQKLFGYDRATAFYSAMPGGLQDMLLFGEEAGGNVRTMSLIHATRVMILVSAIPFFLSRYYDLDLTRPPGLPASTMPLTEVATFVLAGLIGWKVAEKIGLFGASLLGPMFLTAGLSITGIIDSRPPVEMIWLAQLFIGIAVGSRYTGITRKELQTDVLAGLLFTMILGAISVVFIIAAIYVGSRPTFDVLLAFLPGGQSEMALIGLIAGADIAFVVSHHLFRIAVVIVSAPLIGRAIIKAGTRNK